MIYFLSSFSNFQESCGDPAGVVRPWRFDKDLISGKSGKSGKKEEKEEKEEKEKRGKSGSGDNEVDEKQKKSR